MASFKAQLLLCNYRINHFKNQRQSRISYTTSSHVSFSIRSYDSTAFSRFLHDPLEMNSKLPFSICFPPTEELSQKPRPVWDFDLSRRALNDNWFQLISEKNVRKWAERVYVGIGWCVEKINKCHCLCSNHVFALTFTAVEKKSRKFCFVYKPCFSHTLTVISYVIRALCTTMFKFELGLVPLSKILSPTQMGLG